MVKITYQKLSTVFLLNLLPIFVFLLPVLADTSAGDRQNNINYAGLLTIGIIGFATITAGLGFQLKKSQGDRQKLTAELANTNLKLTNLTTDFNSLQAEKDRRVKELESLLEEQMKLEQQLQQQINQIQLKIKELERVELISQETLLSKEVEITNLEAQLKQQKSQLTQKTAELERQLAAKQSQLDLQTKNLENLQQLIKQTELKLTQLAESEINYREKLSNKELEIAKLQAQLKQQESQFTQKHTELEKELAEGDSQINLQSEKIKNAKQLIARTQLKIKQLEQSDRSLQEVSLDKELELLRLQEKLKEQESQLTQKTAELERQLAAKQSQLDLQTKNLENLQQLIKQTELKLTQLAESEINYREKLSNKELEIAKLQAQLKQQESQFTQKHTELEKELAEGDSQINLKTKNLENFQQQIKQIQSQFDRLEKARDSKEAVKLQTAPEYERLVLFLSEQKWQKADRETANLLLKITNQAKNLRLDCETIKNIPAVKFQEIDRLWFNYTQGQFSFSTQLKIWENNGGFPEVYEANLYQKWAKIVGWHNNNWKNYSDLNFTLDAPLGQFPAISLLQSDWGAAWCGKETIELFSKIKQTRSQENKSHRETININNNFVGKEREEISK